MIKTEVKNWDYFNNTAKTETNNNKPEIKKGPQEKFHQDNPETKKETLKKVQQKVHKNASYINNPIFAITDEAKNVLIQSGYKDLSCEVEKIERHLKNSKFKISVVGEFSRGKSTFINNFLLRDILPVGNLPTTALLTKVTYSENEMMLYIDSNGNKKPLPLKESSWDNLVADFEKVDPQGVVFVGIKSEWLAEKGVEIIDTPGAGDLNEKRTLLINDALLCGDGAIITISALNALSQSEEVFIRERLISQKIPHLLLILTRLDQVKEDERSKVIKYLQDKLASLGTDIPVFIPQNISVTGMDCSAFMGIDNIKNEIEKWTENTEYQNQRNANACVKILSLLNISQTAINNKIKFISLDEQKRIDVQEKQKDQIAKTRLYWEDLRLEMMKRCNKCYEWLRQSINEKTEFIIERLQYEVSHSSTPQKWWEEDYPYRLKIELMNLATSLENGLSQNYSNDVHWFNETLNKNFKAYIITEKEIFTDKDIIKETTSNKDIEFEDVNKKKTWVRIGTGAATIAGYVLFAGLGPLAMITSISVGTGSTLISEKIFKNKIEKQHSILKESISKDVPNIISNAMSLTEKRLNEAYSKVIKEAENQEEIWVKTQIDSLVSAENNKNNCDAKKINEIAKLISDLTEKLKRFIGE